MNQEPQKHFPKVSDCCSWPVAVVGSAEGTYYHKCTNPECKRPSCDVVSDEGLPTNKDNQPAQEKCDVCGTDATTLTEARRGPKNFCNKCCPSYFRPIKIDESQCIDMSSSQPDIEAIKKNVMPFFICEVCGDRIDYPYPKHQTICLNCSILSQPSKKDHGEDWEEDFDKNLAQHIRGIRPLNMKLIWKFKTFIETLLHATDQKARSEERERCTSFVKFRLKISVGAAMRGKPENLDIVSEEIQQALNDPTL